MPTLRRNHLLEALSTADAKRLRSHLEPVEMRMGDVLHEPQRPITHVYFPTSSIVSLLQVLESGASAEIAVVGNEGMVGISAFMGSITTTGRAVVQSGGGGSRMTAAALRDEFERGDALQRLMLRYTQALIVQMAQTAVCYRHHSVVQQLSRWLLLSIDRLPKPEIAMTQELLASVLGVRREGITEAAGNLQKAGAIRYARGHIRVLDRARLEALSCECYGVVRRESARLLADEPG